jgi:hypothetical protein
MALDQRRVGMLGSSSSNKLAVKVVDTSFYAKDVATAQARLTARLRKMRDRLSVIWRAWLRYRYIHSVDVLEISKRLRFRNYRLNMRLEQVRV